MTVGLNELIKLKNTAIDDFQLAETKKYIKSCREISQKGEDLLTQYTQQYSGIPPARYIQSLQADVNTLHNTRTSKKGFYPSPVPALSDLSLQIDNDEIKITSMQFLIVYLKNQDTIKEKQELLENRLSILNHQEIPASTMAYVM